MAEGAERRRHKRMELGGEIIITQIGGAQAGRSAQIEIVDMSQDGLGFNCIEQLTLGCTYKAILTIWTKEKLNVFLKVVRGEERAEGDYHYGAIFIGMPEDDTYRISAYEAVHDLTEEGKK